jgi:hypothetical protein
MEMTGYWWPTVATQCANAAPPGNRRSHCSAFIATGSATRDGRIVIGHESFTEFWNGQYFNVIVDLTPDEGYCNWQQGYLQSRPSQPWTFFEGATR